MASAFDDSRICQAVLRMLQQGKFADAARMGELAAIRDFNVQKFSISYYSLLAASHLANGSFPAARLTVVRAVAEHSDKSLDFLARLLDARNRNRYNDALNALKSAPEDVRSIFQDILICELAATTAAAYKPPAVSIVAEVADLGLDEVKASLKRMGAGFGVALDEAKGLLSRITPVQDRPDQKQQRGASAAAGNSTIASVKLVTDAALMTARPVDRYWGN